MAIEPPGLNTLKRDDAQPFDAAKEAAAAAASAPAPSESNAPLPAKSKRGGARAGAGRKSKDDAAAAAGQGKAEKSKPTKTEQLDNRQLAALCNHSMFNSLEGFFGPGWAATEDEFRATTASLAAYFDMDPDAKPSPIVLLALAYSGYAAKRLGSTTTKERAGFILWRCWQGLKGAAGWVFGRKKSKAAAAGVATDAVSINS